MAYPERRTAQRFRIKLPMIVRWTSGSAVGEAQHRIERRQLTGSLLFPAQEVKNGSPVEIVLTLPHEITLAGPVRVRCLDAFSGTRMTYRSTS